MKLVSVKQMRDLDHRTINEYGTPGVILMERAGIGAVEHLLDFLGKYHPCHIKRIVFLAGKGNNGGDAYVMARDLYGKVCAEIIVYSICPVEKLKGDALLNAQNLPEDLAVEVRTNLSAQDFCHGDIIVDGLLGTGIKGSLKAPFDNWINVANSVGVPVVALDIPSGLDGDTGEIMTAAINADLTLSMGLPKTGYTQGQGPEHCGQLRNVEIGIPRLYIDELNTDHEMTFGKEIRQFIVKLPSETHKTLMGRILVLGGSRLYRGAPLLTGKAALRSGAGLVTVVMPKTCAGFSDDCCSLIVQPADDEGKGIFTKASLPIISENLDNCDAVILGPGISSDPEILPVLKRVINSDRKKLFDADALNLIAQYPSLWSHGDDAIVTPHPGEFRRLMKGFKLDKLMVEPREIQAEALAERLHATVVLKGNLSIIKTPGKKLVYNSSGCPALATAGSGDVLSGIISAWLCHCPTHEAATIGAFIHGMAGELFPYGQRGLIADDLIDLIPETMAALSPFA